jgi:hypothetical protein
MSRSDYAPRVGRPPKASGDRREHYLHVRLKEAQYKELKDAADAAGISLSAWVVERLLRLARLERSGKV